MSDVAVGDDEVHNRDISDEESISRVTPDLAYEQIEEPTLPHFSE